MAGDLETNRAVSVQPGSVRAPAALESCLSQIESRVAQSFSAEQLRALEIMLEQRRTKRHKLDLQTGFSWGGKRYYLSVFFGRDRRSLVRKPDTYGQEAFEETGSGRGLLGWLIVAPLLLVAAYAGANMAGVDLAMADLVNSFLS